MTALDAAASPTGKNQARDRTAWLPREDSNLEMQRRIKPFPTSAMKKAAAHPVGNSLQDAANSLLVSINSLFGAIKFPVPISRELSSNKLILLRSDGQILAQQPNFCKIPCYFPC